MPTPGRRGCSNPCYAAAEDCTPAHDHPMNGCAPTYSCKFGTIHRYQRSSTESARIRATIATRDGRNPVAGTRPPRVISSRFKVDCVAVSQILAMRKSRKTNIAAVPESNGGLRRVPPDTRCALTLSPRAVAAEQRRNSAANVSAGSTREFGIIASWTFRVQPAAAARATSVLANAKLSRKTRVRVQEIGV